MDDHPPICPNNPCHDINRAKYAAGPQQMNDASNHTETHQQS